MVTTENSTNRQSRIPGFYKLSARERLDKVKEFAGLTSTEVDILNRESSLSIDDAEQMVENVISTMPLPFCISPNFVIDNKEYLVPMVTIEPSVVAGASNAAKMTLKCGG